MHFKKSSSFLKQYIYLLENYYHVDTIKQLIKSLRDDILAGVIGSGSGLLQSIVKGFIAHLFIKSKTPLLIGRNSRIMHSSNIKLGHHVWLKDRVSLLAHGQLFIGDNCVVGEGTELYSYGKGLRVGNNVGIGKNCYIAQLGGSIHIGNDVMIADFVRIYSITHKYQKKQVHKARQGYKEFNIVICDDVWIGSGSIIFNSVTIGQGSVIGANTLVNRSVPKNVVFAGSPGRIIKKIR